MVWDENSFRLARSKGIGCIQEIVASLQAQEVYQSNDHISFIVVDDNMHLRSMRREIYVIARNYGLPHLTVFVDVPIQIALERNESRNSNEFSDLSGYIPSESFNRIADNFQVPSERFIYDRNLIKIESSTMER